jgi:hypothetical protein
MAAMALSAAAFAPAASAAVLNVTFAGSGTGSVVSNPTGIGCSNEPGTTRTACTHDFGFFLGTGTLTATGGDGAAFLSWSGDAGGTCTGATNPCTTGLLYFGNFTATATFAPKPNLPTVVTGAASDVAFPSATVAGSVNPNSDDFAIRDCHFEYGLTTDYGDNAACRPDTIGTGTSPVAVSASIGVLEPGKTYHYRLVASNGGGESQGEDRTFTSAAAPGDDCPNAAIRAQQGALAQRLPNCGAYELVSPPFTAGQGAPASAGTADGNTAMIYSVGGFAGTENLPDIGTRYVASRTESGWKTSAISPPASDFPFIGTYGALDWTRDGSRSLWFVTLKADAGTDKFAPIVRDPDGTFHIAGPTQDDISSGIPVLPVATSADLRTVVQGTLTRPPLTDGTTDTRPTELKSVYVSTRAPDGQLSVRQLAYRAGATMFPTCGATLGGPTDAGSNRTVRNAISSDGTKLFFSATCGDVEARRVWAKVGDDEPVDLSASQCPDTCGAASSANFRGASRDGSRVYFTTEQQLLPEDQDTSDRNDIYEYDFNATGQRLRLVTGGSDAAGAAVDQGGLFRVSDDGAYVYFGARGRALAGPNSRGVSPQAGGDNVYVYHRPAGQADGTTTFIGAREAFSIYSPQISSTGRFLLLPSTADMTDERLAGDAYPELYRYDAQEDELLRVWTTDTAHNGAARVDGPQVAAVPDSDGNVPSAGMQQQTAWNPALQMSDDGSLVGFTTAEPLSPDDHNTRTDAYLWQADTGRIILLTDGTSKPGNRVNGSQFNGMTPSGDSLFVLSASPLLKGHTNGQNAGYVIRKDGGFPDQALPPDPCAGDVCQGPPAPPPPAVPVVGSVDFTGPGNAPSTSVSVAKAKAVVGSAAKIKVTVPESGRLSVSGASVRKAGKSADKAQTVTVTVSLTANGKKTLKKKQRLVVKARVAFRSATGASAATSVTITFKQPKANKKGGR